MNWRLLVKECFTRTGLLEDCFFPLKRFGQFFALNCWFFLVFENKPAVHSGGLPGGGTLAVAIGVSDR